jgi:hypothetical protein
MIVAHPGEILDKEKFLFVSLDGLIADIAWQVVKEAHEVKLFCDKLVHATRRAPALHRAPSAFSFTSRRCMP